MKATGIIRNIDNLGRVVLPKELRRTLKLDGAAMEIFVEGDSVILKKYEPYCCFCGEGTDVVEYMGKNVCKGCRQELGKQV